MDNEVWRWLWTGAAIGLGLGEALTATFFLLPFALGAGVAALLAWVDVHVVVQWIAFFAGTAVSWFYVQRFARAVDRRPQEAVGANRFLHARGVVVREVDDAGSGLVRVHSEEWRATTEGRPIAAGQNVVVIEVRGTKLVVLPDI